MGPWCTLLSCPQGMKQQQGLLPTAFTYGTLSGGGGGSSAMPGTWGWRGDPGASLDQ